MTQPSSVPRRRLPAIDQRRYIQDSGSWLVTVLPGMWSFSAGRQQWSPQVHFKGIVVKTPSKIRRSFECLPPRCCALRAARSE
jgi:hypothetical protein